MDPDAGGPALDHRDRIYVAGHRGMVGSAILRKLGAEGYRNLVTRTHAELDLTDQRAVDAFFERERPDYVVLAAAKVGGIHANNIYPAEFIYQNLMIEANMIHAAYRHGVRRLLFLGSSCIYPRLAPQPMSEEALLTGPLEPTNEPYAIAKIAGIKLCESYNRQYRTHYHSVMPTNLYGPNDNFDPDTGHVIPALIRKFHEAKMNKAAFVEVWGTGRPRREFLHVYDLADACLFIMEKNIDEGILNIGTGKDISIKELAELIKEITDYRGAIVFNSEKPDGAPRKLLDVSKLMSLGWAPQIPLREGLEMTYRHFCDATG